MWVDYITAVLARPASSRIAPEFCYEDVELRVIVKGSSFAGPPGDAFDQIRRSAEGNVAVMPAPHV